MVNLFCLALLLGFSAFSLGFQIHEYPSHLPSPLLRRLPSKVGPIAGSPIFTKALMESSRFSTVSSSNSENDQTLLEPLGVGVWRDFSRRFPYYISDFKDGLNSQTLATTLFLFFACATPAIGFGSISNIATNGVMGVIEMVVSTAVCGILYSLFAPQPIQIIGPMGPVLAYTISLYKLSEMLSLPFLPFYAVTGLWTSAFLMLCALTSASNIVKYLTRFTDEIFSVLISTIFMVGAVNDVSKTFTNPSSNPATALLALTCSCTTFLVAKSLRAIPKSTYFNASIRKNLSNFSPAIGVLVGSLIARAARLKWGLALPALQLPAVFATTTGRPWLVPLTQLPLWAYWGAALPAALVATVLLFLDQNITARVTNHPRFKQVKGREKGSMIDGMHGDMFVISILTGLMSVFGLPWQVGGTTRSAAHVRSLSILDKNGQITGTLEQRISGIAIHMIIGACVLLPGPRNLLAQVPLAVLSGVFLYLGFTSLQGLELWDRIKGLIQDSTTQYRWSSISKFRVNLFTCIQMSCVAAMMRINESRFGVVSPLVVALLPLIRRGILMSGIVDKNAMAILDQEMD